MTTTDTIDRRPFPGAVVLAPVVAVERRLAARTFVVLCLLHVVLAFLFQRIPLLATLHGLATFLVGTWLVLEDNRPERAIYCCAYIVGSELLWRVAGASLFWEVGKYQVILFATLLSLRYKLFPRFRPSFLLYPLLLMPSILALPEFDRREIAFNLSGPVSLAVCVLLFSTIRLEREQLIRTFAACIFPIVGLTALTIDSTLRADPARLMPHGSLTTAGFGPNQVSSVLGLGMTLAFLMGFVVPRSESNLRRLAFLVAIVTGIQALLSFSRGGLWTALGAIGVASWYLLRNPRLRRVFLGSAIVILPILLWVVIPTVDSYTRGLAVRRFRSTDLTGRGELMLADLLAFSEHPLIGVGPGQSATYHERFFRRVGSHTEYTRLLAEHGLFGVIALLILFATVLKRVRLRGPPLNAALVMAMTAWTLLNMAHSSMRISAPGFLFGLAAATFVLSGRESEDDETWDEDDGSGALED